MTIGEIDKIYANKTIIGVDEVGRGCIAGNLYIGFVSLNVLPEYPGIDDSKKLKKIFKNDERRFILDKFIKDNSKYLIMQVSSDQINTGRNLNELYAIQVMNGLNILTNQMNIDKNNIVVFMDGVDILKNNNHYIIYKPKFDSLSVNVAAASIIAKNIQVSAMRDLDKEFPQYGFSSHNGYAKPKHKEAIEKYGILPIHRKNWIK
jgi:ribonuclease HII